MSVYKPAESSAWAGVWRLRGHPPRCHRGPGGRGLLLVCHGQGWSGRHPCNRGRRSVGRLGLFQKLSDNSKGACWPCHHSRARAVFFPSMSWSRPTARLVSHPGFWLSCPLHVFISQEAGKVLRNSGWRCIATMFLHMKCLSPHGVTVHFAVCAQHCPSLAALGVRDIQTAAPQLQCAGQGPFKSPRQHAAASWWCPRPERPPTLSKAMLGKMKIVLLPSAPLPSLPSFFSNRSQPRALLRFPDFIVRSAGSGV